MAPRGQGVLRDLGDAPVGAQGQDLAVFVAAFVAVFVAAFVVAFLRPPLRRFGGGSSLDSRRTMSVTNFFFP